MPPKKSKRTRKTTPGKTRMDLARRALRAVDEIQECIGELAPPEPMQGDDSVVKYRFQLFDRTRDAFEITRSNLIPFLEVTVGGAALGTLDDE